MTPASIKAIIKGHISIFRDLSLAISHTTHCVKPHWIVMGDNNGHDAQYWVVTPADAQRLERAGYELV